MRYLEEKGRVQQRLETSQRELIEQQSKPLETTDERRTMLTLASDVLRLQRKLEILEVRRTELAVRGRELKRKEERMLVLAQHAHTDRRNRLNQELERHGKILAEQFREASILTDELQKREQKLTDIKAEEQRLLSLIEWEQHTNLGFLVARAVIEEEYRRIEAILEKQYYKEITIMFVEIKDSMKFFERLGAVEGRKVIETHNTLVFPVLKEYGKLIKSDGDITIGCFDDTFSGIGAALRIMKELERHNKSVAATHSFELRICLHFGQGIIEESDEGIDVFGDVVNTTARFGIHKEEQFGSIIVSKEIFHKHQHERNLRFKFYRTIEAKGKKEPLELYLLQWQDRILQNG